MPPSHQFPSHPGHRPLFRLSGDRGLLVELGTVIDPELNQLTRIVANGLQERSIPGVLDVVAAYASFLIIYDPKEITLASLQNEILACWDQAHPTQVENTKTVDIPVCYTETFGPDLTVVAEYNQLSREEVIRLHTAGQYLIYMIGFAPGFPYLGGLDPRLHTPRLDTPRAKVEAGSVGIANNQTGIYPIAGPGGWQIIGRTPVQLIRPQHKNPVPLYQPGDRLRFVPISEEEFHRLAQEQEHA
ncbi:MAG: 5-oxoprolinase subunit PxpB [Desulfovermiculus sp.]